MQKIQVDHYKDINIVNTIKIIPILGVIYTLTNSHEALT